LPGPSGLDVKGLVQAQSKSCSNYSIKAPIGFDANFAVATEKQIASTTADRANRG
jgi:hypothetical protein